MKRTLLLAAAALLATGTAEARTIVLDAKTTADYILQGGPIRGSEGGPGNGTAGNPVTLVSFDVVATMDADIFLFSGPYQRLGSVTAGQAAHFTPNLSVRSLNYGWWFGHLYADSSRGFHRVATWSNVTIELGDNVTPLPEPASWALMIGGLGMAGAAMRRRARPAAAWA